MKNHRIDSFIKNPKKALYTLTWPIVIGMLVQTLYNIIDTIFVGRLGAASIAAVTFSFPLFFLLNALSSGVSIGMSSRISRMLGALKKKESENTAMHGVFMTMALALVVFIFGIFSMDWIFSLLGASGQVLILAKEYFLIVLVGIFFMFPVFIIHNIFVAQGDTKTPVYIQVIALTANIILDPIFIYTLGYGVKGAAIATTITFFLAMMIGIYLIRKRSILGIRIKNFSYSPETAYDILKVGFPASLMMIIMSLYVIFINKFMAHFGTDYVASFGIVTKLEMFAIMPIMSFSIAVMTLVAMFYGAKRYEEVKKVVFYELRIVIGLSVLLGLIFFIWAEMFIRIFTPDPLLIEIGALYLRVNVFTFPLMAGGQSISRILQGMGFGLPGLIVNITRIVIVAVPLAWYFVYVLNKPFLWIAYAMVAGGIISNIVSYTWLAVKLKDISKPN